MKRMAILLLILSMLLMCVSFSATAEDIDLSGMSFDELVALKDQINLAIWNSQEWQEVKVPVGLYEVGKDIPAGHWSIRPVDGLGPYYVVYADTLDETGHDIDLVGSNFWILEAVCSPTAQYYDESYKTSTDIVMEEGYYVRLDCAMIFTPYSGKPDLGFK